MGIRENEERNETIGEISGKEKREKKNVPWDGPDRGSFHIIVSVTPRAGLPNEFLSRT